MSAQDEESETPDALLNSAWKAEADRLQTKLDAYEVELGRVIDKSMRRLEKHEYRQALEVCLVGFALMLVRFHSCRGPEKCDLVPAAERYVRELLSNPEPILEATKARRRKEGFV